MLDDLLDASGCLGAILEGCFTKAAFLISPFVLAIALGFLWKSFLVGGSALLLVGIAMSLAIANAREGHLAEFTAGVLDLLLVLGLIAASP